MDTKKIGIIVQNDYNKILYINNTFIIELEAKNKNIRDLIEAKLEKVLKEKTFRIDSVSKKIPKLDLVNGHSKIENVEMYLVSVYMYSDNSDFYNKEYILNNIDITSYKDYFLKYLIRYDKYNNMVFSFINLFFPMFYVVVNLYDVKFLPIVDNIFIEYFIYVFIPLLIIYKFIVPSIVNGLLRYNISNKLLKINSILIGVIYIWVWISILRVPK